MPCRQQSPIDIYINVNENSTPVHLRDRCTALWGREKLLKRSKAVLKYSAILSDNTLLNYVNNNIYYCNNF